MKAMLFEPATWEAQAPCRDNPDAWFPGKGTSANERPLAICGQCPFKQACLDKALSFPTHQDRGIWGATTENQRRELRAGRITAEQAWDGRGRSDRQTTAERDRRKAARVANLRLAHTVRRAQTSCAQGHEYTEESTLVTVAGKRDCRTCRARRSREFRARRKLEAAA